MRKLKLDKEEYINNKTESPSPLTDMDLKGIVNPLQNVYYPLAWDDLTELALESAYIGSGEAAWDVGNGKDVEEFAELHGLEIGSTAWFVYLDFPEKKTKDDSFIQEIYFKTLDIMKSIPEHLKSTQELLSAIHWSVQRATNKKEKDAESFTYDRKEVDMELVKQIIRYQGWNFRLKKRKGILGEGVYLYVSGWKVRESREVSVFKKIPRSYTDLNFK